MMTDAEIKADIGRRLAAELGLRRARLDGARRPVKGERYWMGDFGLMAPVGVYLVIQRLAHEGRLEFERERYKQATGGS